MKNRKQDQLPIDPTRHGYPRNAAGEFGRWQDGACFSTSQAEWFRLGGRYSGIDAQFGIVELEDGTWLSDIFVWSDRHPTRDEALRAAADRVIERARSLGQPFRSGNSVSRPQLSLAAANAIITWASELVGREPTLLTPDEARMPPSWMRLPLFSGAPSDG